MENTNETTGGHELFKVFVHNLNRLYFAKNYLNEQMPDLINMASFNTLKLGMQEFWDDVKKQIKRMKDIYAVINELPSDKNCNPIKAVIKEKFCLEEKHELPVLHDMDLIMYVQILEHINIATYGLLITVANRLNYDHVEQLMRECFDESVDNDELFDLITREYIR